MFSEEDIKNGLTLMVDKPLGWSSFQAVNKIKWLIKNRYHLKKIKVGHAGTLDPLATGLLLICTGKFTKTIPLLQGQAKEYTGTIILGSTTPSYDLETEINENFPIDHISDQKILDIANEFTGNLQQFPPIFSALKKDGKRLYEFAREGKEVEIKSREVVIHYFEINTIDLPKVHFKVGCSKGTYIRSLAHDFGKALESGGHLSALRRTKIGEYHVDNAFHPDDFGKMLA